ncbi:polyprenyl diphosphate synthase [Peristeroidobacter soli]|uniref:polyprenyl diphosphate synthase n=1 Tax=Peristeroidobacter soli TaxID=2497877 RepID=UPI00101BA5C7|nr:polyprenyl diphosphate synthase [Peristeroidobacter soli]
MHVAIIMDGNGRWATQRGLPRTAGHRAGAQAVDRVVTAAARQGVDVLTLYAFSQANWQRPRGEVRALFGLFRRYLKEQTSRCLEQSIRLNIIGRRDRLESRLLALIQASEQATAHCTGMILRIAIDYSAQWSLMQVCRSFGLLVSTDHERFARQLAVVDNSIPVGAVDLLIRTGGEQRMSDFLLWECAYAELHFVARAWPDFDEEDFQAALAEFSRRDRRFGCIETTEPVRLQMQQGAGIGR